MRCRFDVLVLSAMLVLPSAVRGELPDAVAYDIACDAYVYAYPLVVMDVSMRQATNVPDAITVQGRAPVNQFRHSRDYPDPEFHAVPTTNFDTLYSTAWLDLSREPIILSVPDTGGRHYVMQLLDLWTDVFDAPGWRTTGTRAGAYAIVGRNWLPIGQRLGPGNTDPNASHAFHLTARLYAPRRNVLDGTWAMPPVQRLQCP
jgi:hypothetical protein